MLALGLLSPAAQADDVYTVVVKKQQEKAKSRWSLSQWLETKEKFRLMDMWLALHSPSPYEFYLGGDYQITERTTQPKYQSPRVYFGAFASIFGLELQREQFPDARWLGMFKLRVFGYHQQATNLTLEVGVRSMGLEGADFRSMSAGAGTSLYFGKYFGIDGFYRHYFQSTPSASGARYQGSRAEAGAFIDFKFLRIYGSYFYEPLKQSMAATTVSEDVRKGVAVGTRLFF